MPFNNGSIRDRAKKILSSYMNELDFSNEHFEKTEILLKESCPTLLKGKPVFVSSRICAAAFDLINFLEWKSGSLTILSIKIKLLELNLKKIITSKIIIPSYKNITDTITHFIFNPALINHRHNQETLYAIHLCLCALITAHREVLDSKNKPTRGPNACHYSHLRISNSSSTRHHNPYFFPKIINTSPQEHLVIIKDKISNIYLFYDQIISAAEHEHERNKIIEISENIPKLQLEIEKLKHYINEHEVIINPRIHVSLNKIEHFTAQCSLFIKSKLAELRPLPNKPSLTGKAVTSLRCAIKNNPYSI